MVFYCNHGGRTPWKPQLTFCISLKKNAPAPGGVIHDRTGKRTNAGSRVLSEQSIYKFVLLCQEPNSEQDYRQTIAMQGATCSEMKANCDVNYRLYIYFLQMQDLYYSQ